jgi:DegV family protein with EDD domain
MSPVATVVDSISCLSRELVEEYGITVVPLSFYFGGKIYRDWVDITPSDAYELFLKDPESFKSAAASPGQFMEIFQKLSRETNHIFCITVSSRISAVYSAALDAREQVKSELPDINIKILDSQTVSAAEGFIALAAARMAAEGGELDEVARAAEEVKDRVSFYAYLDTVRHVYRSGRIPKLASQAGSMLNIKPILTVANGILHFAGMARNQKNGVERILRIMRGKVGQSPVHVAIAHAYAAEEAEKLKEYVALEFNCIEVWLGEFSPLMGYATGTGTLSIAFYCD